MNEPFASIAEALRPRYRLERTLQSGAGAHVFLAEDRAYTRRVAVKVLREEMTATVNAERFMSEIQCAAALRHPNIVPVYDSGEVLGLPYYAMPFVDGETLRARLARMGRLPLAEALSIARDIARALDFAHRHHIVHRDIKPENVMLYGGRALVLDFGIALALDALDMPRRTLPGLTLGTVHYMSPEQAAGDSEVDGRSDIYSLACVIYEMVSGRPPFTGTPASVIRRHLTATPRPLRAACPGTPANVEAVLARALAKDPNARYQTAGEFVAALVGSAPRGRVVGRRIALLPFTHLGQETTIDTFSDGVGEEVAFALGDLEGIVVTPVSTIARGGKAISVSAIARRLSADVVLLGDVDTTIGPNRVQLSAVLYDGWTGRKLWAGSVVGPCPEGLARDEHVAGALARVVGSALGVSRSSIVTRMNSRDVVPIARHNGLRMVSGERTAAR